jgi:hypothetical protein
MKTGRWTADENDLFDEAMDLYANTSPTPWHNISLVIGTRTATQCRTHAQKVWKKAQKLRSEESSILSDIKRKSPPPTNPFKQKFELEVDPDNTYATLSKDEYQVASALSLMFRNCGSDKRRRLGD